MCSLDVYIKSFGGQKGGSSEPPRTPPAYGPESTSQEHYQILSFASVHFHFGLMTTPFFLIYNESWNKIKSRSIWYNNWISMCPCGSALANLMSKNNRQKLDSCKI